MEWGGEEKEREESAWGGVVRKEREKRVRGEKIGNGSHIVY